ncbi:MAG: PQQ-dependent sugar dehydrogenase [Vicinamibacterales bacterium]
MLPRSLICLMIAIATAACGNGRPPTPSPPGTGGETITGRERIGWEQPASSTSELATFRYAVYVDGARAEISGTSCAPTAGASGFACSGALPPMAPGAHTLELAAFYESGGIVESAKSAPLRVTVTGSTSPVDATPLQPGDVVTTSDGVRLTAELLVSGLEDLVDVAVAPGGRLVIAERAGRVRIVSGDIVLEALAAGGGSPTRLRQGYGEFAEALRAEAKGLRYASPDGGLLSLALDPNFSDTGHLFVVHAAGDVFRLIRYRLADDRLIDRMAVIRDVPASADPSAAVRFGPDGKLYVAFDDGGSRDASARMSEWTGKILRLNPDGRTPDDQPAASPVFWAGLRSTWGLDWTTEDGTLWIAEQGPDGLERIRGWWPEPSVRAAPSSARPTCCPGRSARAGWRSIVGTRFASSPATSSSQAATPATSCASASILRIRCGRCRRSACWKEGSERCGPSQSPTARCMWRAPLGCGACPWRGRRTRDEISAETRGTRRHAEKTRAPSAPRCSRSVTSATSATSTISARPPPRPG